MLTLVLIIVSVNKVAVIANIRTVIVTCDYGCKGRASCIVVADVRVF